MTRPVVVYRWCSVHEHVEKGHRLDDGRVRIVAPAPLAEAHAEARQPSEAEWRSSFYEEVPSDGD